MANEFEVAAMRRAVELAGRGRGTASPNPMVGCVVLDASGAVAGEGWYECDRVLHAEIRALIQARGRARGGTLVVTLEPCRHSGRTPPCSEAIVAAGIRRAVIAARDPNPVAAGGAEDLRSAGVDVELGGFPEAERLNEAWFTSIRRRRPFVTWKYAASLDGRSAAKDGTSQWITGTEARADVHRLRAESDAVIVGSGTLLADDPHLTARCPGPRRQPLRVVVDGRARTPRDARLLDDAAPSLVAVAEDAEAADLEGVTSVVRLPRGPRGLDLAVLMTDLYARGVVSALLEGGPVLAASFLRAGMVDRVVAYLAPLLLGGEGRSALADADVSTLTAAHRLRLDDVTRIGADVRMTARPAS